MKNMQPTYEISRQFFIQKLPLKEIAIRRKLTAGTILTHLEKLLETGEKLDISHLQLPAERFEKIKQAFKQSGTPNLSPRPQRSGGPSHQVPGGLSIVKEILGEDFSYDELRLARIFLTENFPSA